MQFNLKLIFALTFVVALTCGAFFSFPPWLGFFTQAALLYIAFAGLLSGIIFARGYGRAFSIGAIPPVSFFAIYIWAYISIGIESFDGSASETEWIHARFVGLIPIVLSLLGGATGIYVRWLCQPAVVRTRKMDVNSDGRSPANRTIWQSLVGKPHMIARDSGDYKMLSPKN